MKFIAIIMLLVLTGCESISLQVLTSRSTLQSGQRHDNQTDMEGGAEFEGRVE
jgi:hypothetical protein